LVLGHQRWPEFIARLSDTVGDGCSGSGSLSQSATILCAMGADIDAAGTIEHFRRCNLFHCDCEVLLFDACRAVFPPPSEAA
jgi:hypothetical protein